MAKLEKILEAMDTFRIDSDVALLENENLDALTVAQTKKVLHESFNFIKGQLIQGGLLEDTQNMLANVWTQAIMEDIHMPSMEDVHHIGNQVAGGAQGLAHGVAGTAGIVSGAAQGGNLSGLNLKDIPQVIGSSTKAGYEQGYNPDLNVGNTYKATEFVGEHPNAVAAGLIGAPIAAGLAAGGIGRLTNKVRRASVPKLPAPQA